LTVKAAVEHILVHSPDQIIVAAPVILAQTVESVKQYVQSAALSSVA
jgi:predicted phosphoribosyltransferase